MSGANEPSRFRRPGQRRDGGTVAWDEAHVSQADRRRLAEVQEARRLRRGEAESPENVVPPTSDPSSVTVTPLGGGRSTSDISVAGPGRHTSGGATDRVHVDPSLTLAPRPQEPETTEDGRALSILVVCTGNVCRSPYFECVLADSLAGLPVAVSGAGTGALLIDRMASGSAALLTARGIDPQGFRPRQLVASMVRDADLVLTATREHRHVVVEEAPAQADRVFALLDFADVCETRLERGGAAGGAEGFRAFVRDAGARTIERRSPRSTEEAAILDPFKQGPEMFERMARQSDPALGTVARTVRAFLA